jgi:hypothetical protein
MTARAEVQPSQGGMRNAAARRKEQDIDGGVDCAGSNTAVLVKSSQGAAGSHRLWRMLR